jgi:hypothetical protein
MAQTIPVTNGLVLWLDAADTSTITTGTNRLITGSTLLYPTITQWADKSGRNNHATVASGRNAPIYVSNVDTSFVNAAKIQYMNALANFNNLANNKPAVVVRGRDESTADTLLSAGVNISGVMTFFGVFRKFADGCTFGSPQNNNMFITYSSSYGHFDTHSGQDINVNTKAISSEPYKSNPVLQQNYSIDATTVRTQFYGNEAGSLTRAVPSNTHFVNQLAFTGRYNGETASSFIMEVIFYNTILSTSERQQVEGYLAHKWGFASQMPVAHPYYSVPPNYVPAQVAPTVSTSVTTITSITEDSINNSGTSIASIISTLGSTFVSAGGAKGIAITSRNNANGTWQYRILNTDSWSSIPIVSDTAALLLDSSGTSQIRFVPNSNYNGISTFIFKAWDLTAGTAGSTADTTYSSSGAFSSTSVTATITISAVNDAPIITAFNVSTTSIIEDITDISNTGFTVGSILSGIVDIDSSAQGIAIVASQSGWQWRSSQAGNWQAVSSTVTAALLLDSNSYLRYTSIPNFNGTITLTFKAWDQTSGTVGSTANVSVSGDTTAFSSQDSILSLTITAVNDPPVINTAPSATKIQLQNAIQDLCGNFTNTISIANLLDISFTDIDSIPSQIAITYTDNALGSWQWRMDASASWTAFQLPVMDTSGLVLPLTAELRLIAGSQPIGNTFFRYKIFDNISGAPTAGSIYSLSSINNYISSSYSTADIEVEKVTGFENKYNIIPVLPAAWPVYFEDLFTVNYKNIPAITAFLQANGFSSLSDLSIIPNAGSIEFIEIQKPVLFSQNIELIGASITSVISPEEIVGTSVQQFVADLSTNYSANNSSEMYGLGFELSGTQNYLIQFKNNSADISWQTANLSASTILLLDSSGVIRILPSPSVYTAVIAQLKVRAWNALGGSTGINTTSILPLNILSDNTFSYKVPIQSAANTAPVLTTKTISLPQIDEDSTTGEGITIQTILNTYSIQITDTDPSSIKGIAVIGVTGTGSWQWRSTIATPWQNMGTPTTSAARLLPDSSDYSIRYIPGPNEYGDVSFAFKAWDQTSGIVGGISNTPIAPNSPFSSNIVTVIQPIRQVNDAPYFINLSAVDLSDITEDLPSVLNNGIEIYKLVDLLQPKIRDIDPIARPAIAIVDLSSSTDLSGIGVWQLLNTSLNAWIDIPRLTETAGLLLDPLIASSIRFKPALHFAQTVQFGVKAWDLTSGASETIDNTTYSPTGAFSRDIVYVRQRVNPVNDAPILVNYPVVSMDYILEDIAEEFNYGITLSLLRSRLGTRYKEVDLDASSGFAFTSTTSSTLTQGTWQWMNVSGGSWQTFDFNQGALLLPATNQYKIRFQPVQNYVGFGTLFFRAWDQTDGAIPATYNSNISYTQNGAYSIERGAVIQPVQNVNDQPTLTTGVTLSLGTITENPANDDNYGISTAEIVDMLATYITDIDSYDQHGIAITGADTRNGVWQWLTVTQYLSTIGTGGYSIQETLQWMPGTNTTVYVTSSNTGIGVDTLRQDQLQYALSHAQWSTIGASYNSALCLTSNYYDRIRFVPNSNYAGESFILFNTWDQTQGEPGTAQDILAARSAGNITAFSENTAIGTITVDNINSAPIFNGQPFDRTFILSETPKNKTSRSLTIFELYTHFEELSLLSDSDGPGKYVAIYSIDNRLGRWEYSENFNSISPNWAPIVVSKDNVLHLEATYDNAIRFRPFNSSAGITTVEFLAWDGTVQTFSPFDTTIINPTSGYSANEGYVSLQLTDNEYQPPEQSNPKPSLDLTPGSIINNNIVLSAAIAAQDNNGIIVADLYQNYILPYLLNSFSIQLALAIYNNTNDGGNWEYQVDGATTWVTISSLSTSNAFIILNPSSSQTKIRFTPTKNKQSSDILKFKLLNINGIQLIDAVYRSIVDYYNIIAANDLTITANVSRAAVPPLITQDNLETVFLIQDENVVNTGITVSDLVSKIINKTQTLFPATLGIAIRSTTTAIGQWQISLNNGDAWTNIPTLQANYVYALKNSQATRIRFLSNQLQFGTDSIVFSVWDEDILQQAVVTQVTSTIQETISVRTAKAIVTVVDVNQPPTLIFSPLIRLPNILQDVDTTLNNGATITAIYQVLAPYYIDVDISARRGFAIDVSAAINEVNGSWQYKRIYDSTWSTFNSTLGDYFLFASDEAASIRFQPTSGYFGTVNVPIVLWDRTFGSSLQYALSLDLNNANSISTTTARIRQIVQQRIYVPVSIASDEETINVQLIAFNG